ncbi:M23 family metallopeptidase [Nocardia sp. NPDC048505]|uniref:M23 family metallopeptidase n=1 Tax=unclassified Nocardia TaxID=2637762 RepID=UPI0033CB8DC4
MSPEQPVSHRADPGPTGRFRVAAGTAVATGALLGSVAQLAPATAVAAPPPPPTDLGAENPLDAGLRWLSSLAPAPPPAPVVAEQPAPPVADPEPAPAPAPAPAPFGFAHLPPQIAGPLAQAEQIVKNLQDLQQQAPLQAAPAPATPAVLPVAGQISSEFGSRWGGFHYGVDIADALGTPIHSAMGGTVLEAGPASGFGQWVRVQQDDGTIAVYGHVNDYYVHPGQRVEAGEVIASVGNRGQSTGPHLHLEIWDQAGNKIDPVPWLADNGVHMHEHWGED